MKIYNIIRYNVTKDIAPFGEYSVVAACSSMESAVKRFNDIRCNIIGEYTQRYTIDTDDRDFFVITEDEEEWFNWDKLMIKPIELED